MKFSVAMCTYNGARYVGAQLASIAAQTRAPEELVVCDDRSDDQTTRVVEEFAASVPFAVRLLVNEERLGSTRNFERAVSMCAGDLVALCDQDDVWMPDKLEAMSDAFGRAPGAGLVFSDAEVVDENLHPLGRRLWESVGFDERARRLIRGGRALDVLLPGWTVTGATMAFRASFTRLALDIPRDAGMIHDGWIALVVASVSGVELIDRPLIKYRQHPRQQVGAPLKKAGEDLGLSAALARGNDYGELIMKGGLLRERLTARCGEADCGAALARLDSRLRHLRARAELPRGRLARLPRVARELLARRYHQYSNGFYSAVKDVLA
jgi:glycosyltransferase involved in cell wall biosynthesis